MPAHHQFDGYSGASVQRPPQGAGTGCTLKVLQQPLAFFETLHQASSSLPGPPETQGNFFSCCGSTAK